MRLSVVLLSILLPFLTTAVITKYDTTTVNSATLIYQKFFVLDQKSSSFVMKKQANQPYLELEFNVTKANPAFQSSGVIEAYFGSEEFYQNVGYKEGDKTVVCCDTNARNQGHCINVNHLIVKNGMESTYTRNEISIPENGNTYIYLRYNVPTEGPYYMMLAMCDPATTNVNITGEAIVMNPYGHLPGRIAGLYPFSYYLLLLYILLIILWFIRCIQYKNELMNVHYMISFVLIMFTVDTFIRYIGLKVFNSTGVRNQALTIISLISGALTRTVARYLTLMITMGVGISRSCIGDNGWKINVLCGLYFIFSLWDSYVTTFSSENKMDYLRVIPASINDALIYFWILQSLMKTIDELSDKKQTSKLKIFVSLRNIIIIVIILATAYNLSFSYLIVHKVLDTIWKYQWFFNEGVWCTMYFCILCAIAYLWAPNEHSLAYAYHIQVATDENSSETGISLQDGELQPDDDDENVQVTPVEIDKGLKPMNM